jgi:hypothetical protein
LEYDKELLFKKIKGGKIMKIMKKIKWLMTVLAVSLTVSTYAYDDIYGGDDDPREKVKTEKDKSVEEKKKNEIARSQIIVKSPNLRRYDLENNTILFVDTTAKGSDMYVDSVEVVDENGKLEKLLIFHTKVRQDVSFIGESIFVREMGAGSNIAAANTEGDTLFVAGEGDYTYTQRLNKFHGADYPVVSQEEAGDKLEDGNVGGNTTIIFSTPYSYYPSYYGGYALSWYDPWYDPYWDWSYRWHWGYGNRWGYYSYYVGGWYHYPHHYHYHAHCWPYYHHHGHHHHHHHHGHHHNGIYRPGKPTRAVASATRTSGRTITSSSTLSRTSAPRTSSSTVTRGSSTRSTASAVRSSGSNVRSSSSSAVRSSSSSTGVRSSSSSSGTRVYRNSGSASTRSSSSSGTSNRSSYSSGSSSSRSSYSSGSSRSSYSGGSSRSSYSGGSSSRSSYSGSSSYSSGSRSSYSSGSSRSSYSSGSSRSSYGGGGRSSGGGRR